MSVNAGQQLQHSFQACLLSLDYAAIEHEEIRGRGRIRSGGAIHLACAAEARVDLFLTHDKRLAREIIPGIQFIATLDTNVL